MNNDNDDKGQPGTYPDQDEVLESLKKAMDDNTVFTQRMADVALRSQAIWASFLSQNSLTDVDLDPANAAPAFTEIAQSFIEHPDKTAELANNFWVAQGTLWMSAYQRLMGESSTPVIEPKADDKRFKDDNWSENPVLDYIKQSYLLTSDWLMHAVESSDVDDERIRKKAAFHARTMIEAMSPSNFAASNPEVIKATIEENGENLVRGMENLVRDLERGQGQLRIQQADMDAFDIGKNMALTQGKIIFENDIFQLIQYTPLTETVHETPLLFIPPWINKYYILDLNEKKSMVNWMVQQGHTVFLISWVNPDHRHAECMFEDYMKQGAMKAIEVVCFEAGVPSVNIAAYCIGGTLTGTMLSYMAATGDDRIKSATLFTTLLEFTDAGELQLLLDDTVLDKLHDSIEDAGGYLPADKMAQSFNMLRSSDLIWSFVVNNYYLGKAPIPFDLLYWNTDSTCMPGKVHEYYLKNFYIENNLAEGRLEIEGHRLKLNDIQTPIYSVATREDHIAPAEAVYRATKLFGSSNTESGSKFILGGSGHIAGVVNPPAAGKYQYWSNSEWPNSYSEWLESVSETEGSWWGDWDEWLSLYSDMQVKARKPGVKSGVIEDAPGRYVQVRFDER